MARDLDFLRDEERAPLAYDDARHGFRLTDETYTLPPVSISRREAFSFALARKLLSHYEGNGVLARPAGSAGVGGGPMDDGQWAMGDGQPTKTPGDRTVSSTRSSLQPTVYSPQPTAYSLATSVIGLWGVFTISSAWRVHTEILYMLLTFSCLALWPRERGPWRGALIPGLLAGAAFMTRTTGLALLPAGAAAFLFRREWKRAATFTTAFILVNLPLILRTMSIEGTPLGYTKYSAEGGLMDKLHTLAVFIPHYLFYGLPDLMFYRLISQDGLLAKLHLGSLAGPAGIAIGLLIAIGFFSRAFRFGVTELYWAAYFLIISSFNQPDYAARGEYLFQDRYVIPVIPIAAWYLVRALIMLGGKRESGLRRTASRVTVLLLSCYVTATAAGAGIFRFKSESVHRGRHPMDPARYADLPNDNDRAWGRYFGCSFWLASNAPSGSVIISRKPYEAFLASGHSSTRYLELGTGTNLLNRIRPWEERGNFIIEDSFTPDTAFGLERIAIIEPLISEHADKFTLVYETQGREARVWRVR